VTGGDERRTDDILDAAETVAAGLQVPYGSGAQGETVRLVTERLAEIIGEATRAMTDAGRAA